MRLFSFLTFLAACSACSAQEAGTYRVKIDTSDAPEHAAWAESAEKLGTEWFPRVVNVLASPEHPPGDHEFIVRIRRDYKGVAYAAGGSITISSDWVTKNPDDSRGVIIHELTHVIQAYPGRSEGWIVEGIADYIRCGIYEGRPLSWFPRPDKPRGYRDAYKVAAGFLLWLEAGPAPGIVRKLNTALHDGKYNSEIFKTATGKTLDELWDTYRAAGRKPAPPLPEAPGTFRYKANGGGTFVDKGEKVWIEYTGEKENAKFEETARTAEHIEIFDKSRGIRLRLTGGAVQISQGDEWRPLYQGDWEKK